MKKLIQGFTQFINECGCTDLGLDTTGAGIKDQVGASVMEEDEEFGEEHEEGGEDREIKISAKGNTFVELLHKLQELCEAGTSFEIAIRPEGEDQEEVTFMWDGDGDDYINSVEIEGEEEYGDEGEEEDGEDFGDEGEEDEEDEDDHEIEEAFNESIGAGLKKLAKMNPEKASKKQKEAVRKLADTLKGKKKKVNETFKAGKTVGGVKVPAMEGPKTGGKTAKVDEKVIRQKNGSYPISGAASLKKAEHAFGRSKDKAKTKAHIKSAAKELGLENTLSDKWK